MEAEDRQKWGRPGSCQEHMIMSFFHTKMTSSCALAHVHEHILYTLPHVCTSVEANQTKKMGEVKEVTLWVAVEPILEDCFALTTHLLVARALNFLAASVTTDSHKQKYPLSAALTSWLKPYRWFSWGVASLLKDKSRGLHLVQLCAKNRQGSASSSLFQ